MAIVCNKCEKEKVDKDGEICSACEYAESHPNVEQRMNPYKIYMEPDIYQEFVKIYQLVQEEKKGAKKMFGKFMKMLGKPFLSHKGKEINSPIPHEIHVGSTQRERIQEIIRHNLEFYAKQNGAETLEEAEDFTVNDHTSDLFHETLYQIVPKIYEMEEEELLNNQTNGGEGATPPSTSTSETEDNNEVIPEVSASSKSEETTGEK